ncbi:rho GTPase-activating protein 30 [Crotalus adamanteus]|uniref:Rho GTPase-activating protein 30 n=1 Tax=Crotalus adamanteus TaxID=8729 RepID=A0AAW1ANR8_CROAD
MASFSSQTNMHVRNLAIVWAPNLLRSKDIEVCGFNGTAAFMEVRIQSIVVEFILTHVEQIFGDAPLCGGTRESIRKSLLAMSPVVLPEYCTPYNVPALLNRGDGPPQMRPYHTIIELSESKRKGSLKAKKWKSIFNLGRSNHDSKRKLNKPEDKEDKLGKIRLRPAKSMDSLSCVPSVVDDDAHLGTEISPKHEYFDGPVSLNSSFSESGYVSAKSKSEDTQEEATKSEPTTPKISRSSLVGGTSQGRSPKSSKNRAEKCAGVHISGPFSVTVPFHITSNLTLSRLTRGLECPALSHCTMETPEALSSNGEDFPRGTEDKEKLMSILTANEEVDEGTNVEAEMDPEESRMSMEVEDSFSFLDGADAWIDTVVAEDQLQPETKQRPEVPPRGLESLPSMEDDLGSGFMHEMIAAGIELEMYSTMPHLDYLSIEECMNEHSEGEDDQYYLAMGFIEEEPSKEVDVEEIYLSAFDDLSPLASKLEHLQQSDGHQTPHIPPPKFTVEDQTSRTASETLVEDPKSSHLPEPGLEPQQGVFSTCDLVTKGPDPKLAKPHEMELDSRSNTNEVESHLTDKAEIEPIFSMLQIEDANVGTSPPNPGLESLLQKPQAGLPVEASYAPKHELWDGSVHMKLASITPRVQQVKSFPVVPPKPQFAKLPPSLKPVIPSKEHLNPVLVKTSENGNKQEFNQSSLKRPFHLTSLDQKIEHFPTSPSGPSSSSENWCSNSDVLPKQRNSMPVSLEKFSKDCKNVEDITPKPPLSSRDKCFSWTKSGEVGGNSLHLMKGFQPGSLEKQNSGQHDKGKGYLPGTQRSTKEGLEVTPQKQRWSNWRYSGSMSFDEAVALAKERHVAQAPMQRMHTYSYGDVDGSQGGSRMEKTAPAHKPVLTSPQRPLSCVSPAGPPEAHLLGKMLCPPDLPDSIPEGLHIPGREGSSFSEDFPLRNRVSLSKIGRRLSVSDEACFGLSHEQR